MTLRHPHHRTDDHDHAEADPEQPRDSAAAAAHHALHLTTRALQAIARGGSGLAVAVLVAVTLALVLGVLSVRSVQGSGVATVAVVIVGIALGAVLVAVLVVGLTGSTPLGAAMSAAARSAAPPSEEQVLGEALAGRLRHAVSVLGLDGQAWSIGREALSRWLDAPEAAVQRWVHGSGGIPGESRPAVESFVRLAEVLEENLRPERIPLMLALRPVALLGGRTYFQALNEGASPELLVDGTNLAAGGDTVTTPQARKLLDGRATTLLPARAPVRRRANA